MDEWYGVVELARGEVDKEKQKSQRRFAASSTPTDGSAATKSATVRGLPVSSQRHGAAECFYVSEKTIQNMCGSNRHLLNVPANLLRRQYGVLPTVGTR